MGRFFSTVYRIILVAVSVTALVLSIMSATSCAFVKFDHQYKSEGRYLLDSNDNNHAAATAVEGSSGVERSLQTTTIGGQDTLNPEGFAEVPGQADAPGAVSGGESPPAGDETPVINATAAEVAAVTAINTTAAEAAINTTTAEAAAETTPTEDAATATTDTEATTAASVETPADDAATETGATTAVAVDTTTSQSPQPDATDGMGDEEGELGGSMTGMGDNEEEEEEFGNPDNDETESASASEATSTVNGASEAAATASGDAGLFCNGEQSFSVTNLWGESIQEFAEDISDMSDLNSSEELARSAVLSASVFGAMATFVLVLESVIGWRVCCDRWIVGLVALCACVSQGVTFLFFNSERYCDGDIINEIMNQEPCVVGQGAIYSIVAIVLYALMLIMACRLPQDDPYGLCCKKRSAARNTDTAQDDNSGSRSKFGLLGGESGSSPGDGENTGDTDASGEDRERPNWLSEEAAREKEEKEII